jgi:quercetin dioxygenase-like cupin family protein
MQLYAWDHVREEPLSPSLTRQAIHGEKLTLARFHLRKGCVAPLHSHVHEQCCIVQSGRLHFIVGEEEAMLQAGDMLMIPPNVPHTVEALEESIALDIFSPAREDWQQGNDAYLRR